MGTFFHTTVKILFKSLKQLFLGMVMNPPPLAKSTNHMHVVENRMFGLEIIRDLEVFGQQQQQQQQQRYFMQPSQIRDFSKLVECCLFETAENCFEIEFRKQQNSNNNDIDVDVEKCTMQIYMQNTNNICDNAMMQNFIDKKMLSSLLLKNSPKNMLIKTKTNTNTNANANTTQKDKIVENTTVPCYYYLPQEIKHLPAAAASASAATFRMQFGRVCEEINNNYFGGLSLLLLKSDFENKFIFSTTQKIQKNSNPKALQSLVNNNKNQIITGIKMNAYEISEKNDEIKQKTKKITKLSLNENDYDGNDNDDTNKSDDDDDDGVGDDVVDACFCKYSCSIRPTPPPLSTSAAVQEKGAHQHNQPTTTTITTVEEVANKSSKKKVQFNLQPEVHIMRVWNYAYRTARKGNWEVVARDNARFQRRIANAAVYLNPILDPEHRRNIYNSRFNDVNNTQNNNNKKKKQHQRKRKIKKKCFFAK